MEKLALYKINGNQILLVEIFNNREEVIEYLEKVKGVIDTQLQLQFCGEYIAIPTLYFNLKAK